MHAHARQMIINCIGDTVNIFTLYAAGKKTSLASSPSIFNHVMSKRAFARDVAMMHPAMMDRPAQ